MLGGSLGRSLRGSLGRSLGRSLRGSLGRCLRGTLCWCPVRLGVTLGSLLILLQRKTLTVERHGRLLRTSLAGSLHSRVKGLHSGLQDLWFGLCSPILGARTNISILEGLTWVIWDGSAILANNLRAGLEVFEVICCILDSTLT